MRDDTRRRTWPAPTWQNHGHGAGRGAGATAVGHRDANRNSPVTRDPIFQSVADEPITAVAALTLLDEGRLALDEPITR
jgi:hypothetical protein